MEKIEFGSRTKDISKVGISIPLTLGSRPTNGAISTYRALEKLTLRLFSISTISWMHQSSDLRLVGLTSQ